MSESAKSLLTLLPRQTQTAAELLPKAWRAALMATLPPLYRLHRIGTRAEYDGWAQLPAVVEHVSRLQTSIRRVLRRVEARAAPAASYQPSLFSQMGGAPAPKPLGLFADALSEKVWVDEPDGSVPLPAPGTLAALIIAPDGEITPAQKAAVLSRYVDIALQNAPGQLRLTGRAPSQVEAFSQAIQEAAKRRNPRRKRRTRRRRRAR
jgi:hypothetical protein